MEPDHEGREDIVQEGMSGLSFSSPQWSPTMKVGKTLTGPHPGRGVRMPAMEPDHEGREDTRSFPDVSMVIYSPQWSPTMKVGKT